VFLYVLSLSSLAAGPGECSQDSLELKKMREWVTRQQEMPQWSSKDIIGGLPDFRICFALLLKYQNV
jgi:hypothetical protein